MTMNYKSIPLEDTIIRFNREIPEIAIINKIEQVHSVRNLKPEFQKSLLSYFRFLPVSQTEGETIGEQGSQTITYHLQILKKNNLPYPVVEDIRSQLKTLVFVDSFSGLE
jgi:hypothetical protein